MADGYERLPEWFWHPTHGLYGHEEPARPGDRTLYVRVDDAAGSPPPTPAPTREQADALRERILEAITPYWDDPDEIHDPLGNAASAATDAVYAALLSTQPAPPLWTGPVEDLALSSEDPAVIAIADRLPPGTAVEVREKRP